MKLTINDYITFGMYSGRTVRDVIIFDPFYLKRYLSLDPAITPDQELTDILDKAIQKEVSKNTPYSYGNPYGDGKW